MLHFCHPFYTFDYCNDVLILLYYNQVWCEYLEEDILQDFNSFGGKKISVL